MWITVVLVQTLDFPTKKEKKKKKENIDITLFSTSVINRYRQNIELDFAFSP